MESEKRAENTEKLDHAGSTTLAIQLKTIFRDKIQNGEWAPNSMIPSENKLSEIYGVSRMTARGVISQYVSQGYMYRVPGKGTFISDSKLEIASLKYSGIRGQLEEQGHSVETKLISCDIVPAEEPEASMLGISFGEPVYKIKRLRSTNNKPVSYHESFVPVAYCSGLDEKDLENNQLCMIMNSDYMIHRARVEETLESFSADKERAGYLGVKTGFPLLLLQDKLYSAEGLLYEYSRIYFRGDKTKIKIEYRD